MNTIIVLLSLLALVSAKAKEIHVGCHPTPNNELGQFGPDDFLLAVAFANTHQHSKIFVCCLVELINTDFDTTGPVPILFDHEVELIGSHPHHPHRCPRVTAKAGQVASSELKPVCDEDNSGKCALLTAKAINAENNRDECWERPHAWIESYGYWFWFLQKGNIHRLGFIGTEPTAPKERKFNASSFFHKMTLKQGAFINCNDIDPDFWVPNAIIAASCYGGPVEEMTITESVFALDWDTISDVFLDGDFIYAWAFVSFAQELVIKEIFAEALDFHLLARFSSVTEIKKSFIDFFWDLANLLEPYENSPLDAKLLAVKKFQKVAQAPKIIPFPFEVPAQIELKIEDTDLAYIVVDQHHPFPIAYADLGLVSTVLDLPPEIHKLHLDNVVWFNFERVIAAGNLFSLEVFPGWDYQEAKVDDEVILVLYDPTN